MSTEKVVRWDVTDTAFRRNIDLIRHNHGRYVLYADVAGLVEALNGAEQMLFDAAYAFRKIGLEWHGYAETCDSRRAQIETALARFQQ